MSNAYALRLQLFQEAKDYLVSVYDREVSEHDRLVQKKMDLETKFSEEKERYYELKDQHQADVEKYPTYPEMPEIPEYPKYPSRQQILEMAKFIRSFISDKGDDVNG